MLGQRAGIAAPPFNEHVTKTDRAVITERWSYSQSAEVTPEPVVVTAVVTTPTVLTS